MYLKLIILLVGLKLCHAVNQNFTSNIDNDKLFELLRDEGKNYTNELSIITETYENGTTNSSDDEWNKVLAQLHSDNISHPTESYQNDSPKDDQNFQSDENIDDDLKNLLSLGESNEISNEINEDEPFDEFIFPDNFEDLITTPETFESPPYDTFVLVNFPENITTSTEDNQVTTESRDVSSDSNELSTDSFKASSLEQNDPRTNDEISTTTENESLTPESSEDPHFDTFVLDNFPEYITTSVENNQVTTKSLDNSSNDESNSNESSIDSIQLGTRFARHDESKSSEEIETSSSEQNEVTVDANNVTHIIRLDDILDEKVDLKNKFPSNLYGKQSSNQRSLAFVFDSTGSMWDDLEQLKSGAEKIMSAMEERDDNPIYNYILVPFHDPKVGPVTITNDKTLFRHKLEELEVYGGGDCPEMSLGGISMAIDASLPRSYIYVLTDATAADHILVGSILDKVLQKQIQVVFVLTGDCNNRTSPEYTVYEKIAAASSGQVFHLKKSDVNQVLDFVRKTLDSRRENLLVVTNVSPTNKLPHKVAIDNSLDQFTISVSGINPKIDVVNPDGEHINEPPKVEQILDLENIQVINVNNPSNGSWEINVSSGSDHSIRLSGLTDLRIDHGFSVNVPKNMDETNHRPLHGQKTYLLLKPSNDTIVGQITNVDLIGLDGQPLRHNIELNLLPGTNDTYISEKFKPPVSFFNLFIKGEDKNGNPFIRLTNTAIKTQFPEKPFVTVKAPEVYHLVHVPLNISCHVETLVPAKVQWFKNGKAVSDRLRKEQTGWFHWSDMFPNIYTAGLYTCKAENEAGENEANIKLHMIEPPILKKPNKLVESVKPGFAFYADCYAVAGIPSPGIEWMKNEKIITPDSGINIFLNGTLFIPFVTSDHEGLYQCVAANSAGVDTYNLNVRVEVAPSFTVESDNNIAIQKFVDDNLELYCQANGVPKPFITWFKDGIELTPTDDLQILDENTILIIPKLKENHEGLFNCIASNKVGSVNKSISLTVLVPPTIQSPITDDEIQVIEGNEVLLPCLAYGKPKPTVFWIINSTTHEIIEENTNLSFTANRNDSGRYECMAQNEYATVSHVWYLDVFTQPIIETLSLNETIEIHENETLELTCHATGHPKPNLTWKSNQLFDEIIKNQKDNDESVLIFGKIDQTPLTWTCIAENPAGITNKTFTIIVKAPPKLSEHFNNIQILENETLLMPCNANGNPKPNFTWYKNDELLNNGSQFIINSDNSLSIPSIYRNLTAVYKCEARNSEGIDFMVNNVTVLVPPQPLNSVNNNVEVIEGKSIQIKCPIMDSFPPPTVQWFKNGNNVENTLVPKNHTQNNLLFIQTTTIADDGIYVCIATNIAGTAEAQIYLTVLYRPKIKNKQNTPIRVKKHTGDVVQLQCEADGNPTPKTQWLRNNTIISKNNSTLLINNLELKDRDNYTCQASNRIGTDESVYFLDILESPKIQGPDNEVIDVIRGKTSVIMCKVTGFPQPDIVWSSTDIKINQPGIEIMDNGLKILSMDYQHQGNLKCEAINTEGISTKSINIKIKVEPTIKVIPENKTISVKEHDKFILECLVEGIPKPELIWNKNGIELTIENFQREFTARSYPIQSNLTKYTLTARDVTASLTGIYHCNASNSLGTSSSEFNVTILTSPKLKLGTISQNNSIEATENSSGIFICNIDLGNPPAKITWYKNNKILTNKNVRFESNGTILKILNANIMDSGIYNCSASNPIGKIGQSFNFDVLVPPKTDSETQVPIDVVLGDDLKLYCDISGNPKPSIMWLKESSPIEKVNATNELLIVPNALSSDSGEYTCVAINKAGTSKMSFNVKILEPPKFLDTSPAELNINTSIKHGFVLRCEIGGNPPPNITWEKEGRPLFNGLNNNEYHISSDRTHLQFSNPKLSDAGKYLCEAQNSVGILRRQFNVFLKVMAEWNPWTEWSECSVSCGEGVRFRSRLCNYPEEFKNSTIAIDLSGCVGSNEELQKCIQTPCAIDGGWSAWTGWTSCSATCDSGVQYRYRYCNNPSPAYGGADCSGPNIEESVCNDKPCPKDGDWSNWSEWSPCSTTCGIGVRYRSRECDNPKPEYGGRDCEGTYVETIECIQEPCPVNGGWSDWEPWSPCSATCALGRKIRKRHCTNPVPQYGGEKCVGEALMIKGCVVRPCFEDGPKSFEYDISGNISGIPILNQRVLASTFVDGPTQTYKFRSFKNRNNNKDSWLPSLVFLVSPMNMNMMMLENEGRSEEIDYDQDFDDDNEFEQESKVSFQTGQEVVIHQQGKTRPKNGIMEVFIEMDGELPILQAESKLVIDPFTENSIPTSKTTRQASANNYMTIDGKPIKFSRNSKIKYKNRPQLRKLMVEKISAENIAANYDPRKRELNLVMTTNVEDNLDCPKGFETDRTRNICVDVNECTKKLCHSSQICTNKVGSFKCSCRDGYKSLGNGYRCLDVNECVTETHECSHYCKNLPGGYLCNCPNGMILGTDRHTCMNIRKKNKINSANRDGYLHPRNFMDEFINDYPNNYSNEMDYSDVGFGFFNTSDNECPTGFYPENNECLDINECLDESKLCSKAHTCLNTKGSYLCLPAPCPEYAKRDLRTNSCVQYCNDTNNAVICSENAEITQTITYKTLSIMEKNINPGDPLIEFEMETFGKRKKYVSYILQDSTSDVFEVFNTQGGLGILTCYAFPEKNRVHRLIAIGNSYKNAKKTKLLSTTKYIIHVYVYD